MHLATNVHSHSPAVPSGALAELPDPLAAVPAGGNWLTELIEKLTVEGLISMREAAQMYGRGTHKSTPTRHAQKGVWVGGVLVKLEAIRVSGSLCTSRAAVLRFFAAQNGESEPTAAAGATPAVRRRTASKAAAAVSKLLGAA